MYVSKCVCNNSPVALRMVYCLCRHSVGGQKVRRLARLACAIEMSQIETKGDDSIDTLDEHLYIRGMKRVDALPDGHCIIHSWRMGLAKVGTKLEHEDLLQLVLTEISDNLCSYSEFLPDEDLSSQLEGPSLFSGLDYWTGLPDSRKLPLEEKGTRVY